MIQRIQTVYIFIAGVLTSLLFAVNLAELSANNELLNFSIFGIFNGESMKFNGLPLVIFTGIVALLHFIDIFLYKKRILQMRVLTFSILLLLGLFGMFFYFIYSGFEEVKIAFKVPMVFPVVAAILDFLAIRGIGKDEALVRSMDRIR